MRCICPLALILGYSQIRDCLQQRCSLSEAVSNLDVKLAGHLLPATRVPDVFQSGILDFAPLGALARRRSSPARSWACNCCERIAVMRVSLGMDRGIVR